MWASKGEILDEQRVAVVDVDVARMGVVDPSTDAPDDLRFGIVEAWWDVHVAEAALKYLNYVTSGICQANGGGWPS